MVTGVLPLTKFMSSIADHPAEVYLIKINFLMLNIAVVDLNLIRVRSTSLFQCRGSVTFWYGSCSFCQ